MTSKSITAMMYDINNRDADGGGLWLPNIQRQFVWQEDQIARLFDSIMRQYPLSSMLIWKTKEKIRHRSFIQNFNDGRTDLKSHYQPDHERVKRLVLDGQQRLQSLYIGLKGLIDGKVLCLNLLSGQEDSVDEMRYAFEFCDQNSIQWPLVQFSEIVLTKKLPEGIVQQIIKKNSLQLSEDERSTVTMNISRAQREFSSDTGLLYQELDSVSEESELVFDDIVEIFIRANSGGTKLSKSDLMFTLLTTEWTEADITFETFLADINDNGRFQFTRDFLIKLSTTVLGYGAKYDVDKLRKADVRKAIDQNWSKIEEALRFVKDQVVAKTYIRSDKAMTSYIALIPLVYAYYHYPEQWGKALFLPKYLIRVLMAGAFSGHPDALIDKLVNVIKEHKGFVVDPIFEAIEKAGRDIQLSEHRILYQSYYGSGNIHLLFNLWYGQEYKASSLKSEPQVDHLFAQTLLKDIKEINPDTGRPNQKYAKWQIDQLANCMLLTAKENGAGDKGSQPLDQWLKDKDEAFLKLHCIPTNKRLWKIERFEDFITARQKLILENFTNLGLLDG